MIELISLLSAILLRPTFNSCSVYVGDIPAGQLAVELRTEGGEWRKVSGFHGSLLNLSEDTGYEVRVTGPEVSQTAAFRTWSSRAKIAKTITIDPKNFKAPCKVSEKGSADGWVRIVVKGGALHNPDAVPTFIFEGAEYVILDGVKLTGAKESLNVIKVTNSKYVRLQNLDISGWGREGTPDYTRLEGKRNYGPGNGHYVDKWGDVVDYDGAVSIGKGAFGTVVERCWIHDPVSRASGWYYHHPKGPEAVVASKGENTVLRWNDFVGSDDHRWNDAVEGPGNFRTDGGLNRDCDIAGNFMIFSADDCIELDGGQRNIRCFGNRFEGAHCGVSTQGCMVGPSFVYDNLLSGMGDQFGMSAMTIKTDEKSAAGAQIFIHDNILWGKLGGGITMRRNSVIEVKGNTFCEHQGILRPEVSPASTSIDNRFDVKLEEKDLDPTFPRRPLDFTLSRARISVGHSREDVVVAINGKLPSGTRVVKNEAFPWIDASLEGNSLRIKFDDKQMKNRREYRAVVLVRTPEGLSRPLSIYAETDFVPCYTPERKGDRAYYAKGFHLFPGQTDTARIFIDKAGWYSLMVHGKNNLEFSRSATLPCLTVSVDGEQPAATRPAIYPYSNWSPAAKRDMEASGRRCWQYHLQPGEHTVSVVAEKNAKGKKMKLNYEIDGLCLTDNPQSFEPNADLPGLQPYDHKLTTPEEVSEAMSELLLSTDAMSYNPVGCTGRPVPYGAGKNVQYSVVSLWVNAIGNARLRGDSDLLRRLTSKYEPFAAGLRQSLPPTHVDYTIYGALPLAVYRETGDLRALKIGLQYADAQWEKPSGDEQPDHGSFAGPQRLELWQKGLSAQSRYWVDDLYMITLVQVEAYKATGDRKYIDRAALTMAEYLPKVQLSNGLFYHSPEAPFIWGRGAGWVAGGMTLLLENLPDDSEYRPVIRDAYMKMMKGLLKYQRPDGVWGQLVDDPESWPETSGSAMFAYGFAAGVRMGLLERDVYLPAARKAWKTLCTYLDSYGNLGQVCIGTNRKNSREWYLGRPLMNGDPHGQAPMMWLANELIKIDRPSGYALEWNEDYRTDVPYEVTVDPSRLGYGKDVRLAAYADGKALRTILIDDGRGDTLSRLRFSVPAGTKSLRLDGGECVTYPSAKYDNIFRKRSWSADKSLSISETEEGVVLRSTKFDRAKAICRCTVPAGAAGKPCRIELDVENPGNFSFPNSIFFNQYDKDGKLLPEEVSDKRWTTHTRPAGAKTRYREPGYIHPDAAIIVLEIELWASEIEYDYYGLPLLDRKSALPQLLVSHIAVRPAAELPFPGYDNSYFAAGVGSKTSDRSLVLNRDRAFWYCTRSNASWAGGREIRDPKAVFYPTEAGTVEAWFKPEWKKTGYYTPVTLFCTNQELSIVKGHQENVSKGDMLLVRYTPPKPTSALGPVLSFSLMDVDKKIYKGEAEVWIEPGEWVHIAAQWTPGGEAALYVGGKKVISFPIVDFKTLDIANHPHPNDENGSVFYMGADLHTGRKIDESVRTSADRDVRFFEGEADNLRISSVARYSSDFVPSREEPAMDSDTRALFTFNRSFDGRCSGGIGWISGSMHSCEDIVSHTILGKDGPVQYWPAAIPDWNNPYKVLHSDTYRILCDEKSFAASARTHSATFDVAPGKSFDLDVEGEPWMDYVEIANPGKTVLKYPIVLAEGDVDARSYGDMRESLGFTEDTPEREKVDRIFDWLLKGSDYFTFQAQIFDPGTDIPRDMENRPIPLINTYCGYECGPLNNLAVYLFANVAGCPANHTSGYGHSFEEVYYAGKNHIYDLSARKFFPAMNGVEAASLGDADVQDGVIARHGGSPHHFVRLGYRLHGPRVSQFPEKFALKLNPGERLRYWWTNDGNSMNLQSARQSVAKNSRLKVVAYDYSEQAGVNSYKKVYRKDRFIPEYGNGILLFDGKPSTDNPAFCEISGGSFCYRVRSCYPIVAAQYQALDAKGKPVKLEISTDFGAEYRPFISPATYQVRGRYEYLIRVKAPMKKISRFVARTEIQVNSRIIGGRLKEGHNHLTYKAEGSDKAKITLQWRTADKKITFPDAVQWGTIRGCEQSLVVMDPAGKLSLKVEGASAKAAVSALGGLKASLRDGTLTLQAEDRSDHFGWVTVDDGGCEKTLTVMVCRGAILQKFDVQLSKTGQTEKAKFSSTVPEGEYALYSLVRFPSRTTTIRTKKLGIKFSGKKFIPLAAPVNDTYNYFKVPGGVPGGRGPWRWDFAFDAKTKYPSHYMRTFKLSDTENVWFNFTAIPDDGPVEVGALLLVPETDNIDFKGEIIKNLFSLNARPWAMAK